MAISYITGAAGGNSTADIATQAGDLLVAFAWDESNTLPTSPAGWSVATSLGGTNSNSALLASKVATSSSTSSGTFTGADNLIIQVYRSDIGDVSLGGLSDWSDFSFTNTINYKAVTLTDGDGSSWVAGFAGHRSNNVDLTIVPTGWTNRINRTPTTSRSSGCDSTTGVTEWLGQTISAGGSSSAYKAIVVELVETASSVAIDDLTDPLNTNSTLTVNGSGFEVNDTNSKIEQIQGANTALLADGAWSDTQIVTIGADVESTALYYGTHDIKVTTHSGATATKSTEVIPAVNNDYVQLVGVAVAGDRITAIPDLDGTEQLRYQAFLYQGASITPYDVIVNDDATFSISGATPDGNYSFQVRAYDFTDESWGAVGTQSFTVDNGGIIPSIRSGMISSMKSGMISSMITKMIREES